MNDEQNKTGDPLLPGSGSAALTSEANTPEDDTVAFEQPDSTANLTGDPLLPGSGSKTGDPGLPGSGSTNT
jgi:hypothetical protein